MVHVGRFRSLKILARLELPHGESPEFTARRGAPRFRDHLSSDGATARQVHNSFKAQFMRLQMRGCSSLSLSKLVCQQVINNGRLWASLTFWLRKRGTSSIRRGSCQHAYVFVCEGFTVGGASSCGFLTPSWSPPAGPGLDVA